MSDMDREERLRAYSRAKDLKASKSDMLLDYPTITLTSPEIYNLRVNPYRAGIAGEIMPNYRHSNFWCVYQSRTRCTAYFSYKALIGITDESGPITRAYINTDYAHCSRTTSQHMSRFKRHISEPSMREDCDTEGIWRIYYTRVGDDTPARILLED